MRLLKRFLLYINSPPPFLFLAIIMKQLPGARVKQFIKTKGPVYIWYIYICIKTLITIWAMIGSQLLEIQKSINLFVNHRISWYFSFLQTNSLGKSVLSKFSVKGRWSLTWLSGTILLALFVVCSIYIILAARNCFWFSMSTIYTSILLMRSCFILCAICNYSIMDICVQILSDLNDHSINHFNILIINWCT